MNEEMMNRSYEVQVERESLGRYTAKTFGWMFAGLLITFAVAVGGLLTGAIAYVYSIPYWYYILFAAEIGVVLFLSARIEKMSVGLARSMFFLYAVLNGLVFCAYLIIFDLTILWMVFGITSVFFGIMARFRRWLPRLPFSPRFSFTWISSTCSFTCCAFWAAGNKQTIKYAAISFQALTQDAVRA